MLVADRIAGVLQREGAEHVVGFPENRLIDGAARAGMRPVITRTERVAVNIADGFARVTDGRRLLPLVTQYGPGAEAAFAAVAQAHSDRSPILYLPSEYATGEQDTPGLFRIEPAYRQITRFAATANSTAAVPGLLERALHAACAVASGPALLAIANDVLNADEPGPEWDIASPVRRRAQADPADVARAAGALAAAERPVILAGQGVLYAQATGRLVELAELTGIPVATTLNGKSAFPENHPLALGTAARTRPDTVDHAYRRADLLLGIGTSFTPSLYVTPLPSQARLGQIVDDPTDVRPGVEFACIGDAGAVLDQLLAALGGARARAGTVEELATVRDRFREHWAPRLASESAPLSPYRIVAELMQVADRERTVVTHDAGHPRDQIVPFYETISPRGYLGWGKSTQLGTGFGLALGARLARPDRLAVNIMGDAAFGMIGMDVETAVRCRIPIVTIVMNNGLMGGYGEWMPAAVERFGSNRLSGDYAAIGRALGAHTELVREPAELRPALERAIAGTEDGRTALVEVMTHEEHELPGSGTDGA